MAAFPSAENITNAHSRIKKYIHRTPVMTSNSLNEIYGCNLFFKCENLQKVGAFKARGATNAVFSLSEEQFKKGVATHSSGNHAAALAMAARLRNGKAYIVMPETAPEVKKRAVENYGAKITFCKPTLEARETTCDQIIGRTGAEFVHPYDNWKIIEGQATCAKEIFEDVPNLDYLISPVGGGGLLSGSCLSAEYYSNGVKVIGAEPLEADDAFLSVRDGKIYPSINPQTVAEGLLTSLSEKTFSVISKLVDEIITVKESSILSAMRDIWERMKIIIEPSAAVTLAVVSENLEKFEGKRIALIFSGGNVDLEKISEYFK